MSRHTMDTLEKRLCLSTVTGIVFNDLNHNGVQDSGENPVTYAGVNAYLDLNNSGTREDGEPIQNVGSHGGNYRFEGLAPNTYTVRLSLSNGVKQTLPASGGRSLTVAAESTGTNSPFGVTRTYGLYVTVLSDANANVTVDGADKGVAGKTVWIDADNDGTINNGEKSAVTNSSGIASFEGLYPGSYKLRVVPGNGVELTGRSVTEAAATISPNFVSQSIADVPVGTEPAAIHQYRFHIRETPATTGGIAGAVWNDVNGNGVRDSGDAGIANAGVYIDGDNSGGYNADTDTLTQTNGEGRYSFTGVTPGTYTVRQVLPTGWVQTYPAGGAAQSANVVAGATAGDKNFGRRNTTPGVISGVVFGDTNGNGVKDTGETGQAGRVVYIDADRDGVFDAGETNDTTDDSGAYSFDNVAPGGESIRVRVVVPAGLKQTSPDGGYYSIAVAAGQSYGDRNFGLRNAETPLPPPTETGDIAQGKPTSASSSDSESHGARFATDGDSNTRWNSKATNDAWLKVDLGKTYKINKVILNWGAVSYASAYKVQVSTDNVNWTTIFSTTAGNGGLDTLTVDGTGRYIRMLGVTSAAANGYGLKDFNVFGTAVTPPPTTTGGIIRGYLFNDSNANGTQDGTETRAGGKTVFLDTNNDGIRQDGEKMVTSSSGEGTFSFTGLAAGTYHVRRLFSDGYTYSTPLADIVLSTNQVVEGVVIGGKFVG